MVSRATYHHGDLRSALITAGIGLARDGGPQAVVLREVTRAVGVAPNSAYGHFATLTALKKAVAEQARGDMAEAMAADLDAVAANEPDDPAEAAKTYLIEVGRAYVRFALAEPGLFRTAMGGDPTGLRVPAEKDDDGRLKPKVFLLRALTRLSEAGCMRPGDTERAVLASWATVHGLSMMLLDLLPQLSDEQKDAAVGGVLDVLVAGLSS
ncbi:WHG domain-containing protein [Actinoplanes bogorensis]|uniref:WHG domain-containing protein n=1 Tax=Paractinoplanes bogorensis TaxID=1610840 RepID=A0ABS5YXL6_9ACTN|nr:TetR-like C-terminal domain-containing protein [Actinoplanes bogorensis]MBU2668184.1 WHG domain-containing protein [Actinoplanes bogorensis]